MIEVGKLYRCRDMRKSSNGGIVFITSIEKERDNAVVFYYLNNPDRIYRENIRWATEYWVEVC